MKLRLVCALASVSLSLSSVASAAQYSARTADDSSYYLGAVLSRVNYKEDGFSDAHPSVLALMGGWRMNPYFGLEARLGSGVASDSIAVPGVGSVDLKVRSCFSALVRGSLPVSDQFDVYAVAGATRGGFSASVGGVSASGNDSSLSYGVGMEFLMGTSHSAVGLEAGKFLSGSRYDADALSITFRHNF